MSIDLLNIARTGVLASQAQLGVTSNNIANVNTEGYNRQVATQATHLSQRSGNSFYGTGTYVSSVKRVYNEYAARELRIGQTAKGAAEVSHTKMSELDQLFSQIGKAIPQSLNDMFKNINSLADLPSDLGIRGGVLGSAQQMASAINEMQRQLEGQMKQTHEQIDAITTRVNEISTELANINRELMKTMGEDMQLLDKQDSLIMELSEYAQVNVIPLENGAKSIMLGGAVMLVSSEVAMSIGTAQGDPYSDELRLTATTGTSTLVVDPSKLGGQLSALYEFRDKTLIPAENELGQLSLGIANAFNEAQKAGFDMNGQIGSNIFLDINDPLIAQSRVGQYGSNTGTASLSVSVEDVGALSGSAYELKYTAPATYELTDTLTGDVTPLTLSGSTLTGGAGFSINIGAGAFADGDRFLIRPTSGASAQMSVVMTDPKGIAAAAPKITADATNSGNTKVEVTSIDNRLAANFPVTGSELTFTLNTGANTYDVTAADGTVLAAGVAYTPPSISAFGFTFEVESTGAATDSFTFDLSYGEGDNTNALAMAQLADTKLMNGGKSTLIDVFEKTKQQIGSGTKAAEVRLGSAEAIYQQAYGRVQEVSGVNLDEEAANLLRFQQSYQASARIMTTAQQIFDTLFASVR
ncbi:flagellar hook-associated protein FlgK [Shewanella litorisediminis]|uniref:Flagellar hook-associated protein 1 n=1 Tax=Shewanella litorisediminis TaxID=1173586 RepID=A0ABX7FZX8_9GAMM|nr:flagellar hook-associated protein FlgK [Shewanella litorisediminis]MCL2919692.1 flagellar hook-associated protein FlgK [Shewanella litorisediminis]QRH00576.1 flagellar hook-associated protein FlgK [Shewanella litorisediminis]